MRKDIYTAVARHFDYNGTDSFFDVVDDLVERVDIEDWKDDDYDAVWQAIDEGLIYTRDQWIVLEHYCTPTDADFDDAVGELASDISNILSDIYEQGI